MRSLELNDIAYELGVRVYCNSCWAWYDPREEKGKVRKKKCTIGKFENITFQVLFNAWMVWLVWCSKQNNQGIYGIQHVRAFEYFLIDNYYNILYTNHILLWLFLVLFLILVYIFFEKLW